ncbi:diguanylate cyclase [Salmonella enterica subsp. enterica]|uniref:diguanylate cyclase n=1 Tax=Salmonella enterica I TaxID=59201 RepID=A0A3S4HNJ4_SALET|nr:diguanylate cyclase [Salmonella enterica subsp. enterica]
MNKVCEFSICWPCQWWESLFNMLSRNATIILPNSSCLSCWPSGKPLNGLSMLDPLTGLYNRRGLQNRLDTLQAPGSHEHYVLLLDIDHFKAYNDHYGHMMGDQALIRVSAAIRDRRAIARCRLPFWAGKNFWCC